jgi:uncharacterized membrane protein YgdD (TMEM256/DUF423 family)
MTPDRMLAGIGALSALVGVVGGAFGAHALRGRLTPDLLAVFETGIRYQVYHALALFAAAWAHGRFGGTLAVWAGWLFVAGTVIFSGSLYGLALSGVRALGAITPLGGVCLIVGWGCLAYAILGGR